LHPVIDYYTNEADFNARVEKDATNFKPFGEKIYSYKRSMNKGKAKAKASRTGEELDENSDDVAVFEVYYVREDTPSK
jgi:histone acetyltransferase 1